MGKPELELHTVRRWRSPGSLLLPIGEAMAKFVCEESFEDVKACEGASCTLVEGRTAKAEAKTKDSNHDGTSPDRLRRQ
jgi:hypothetical protein